MTDLELIIPCGVLDCKHNDKDSENPKCTTTPRISRDAKCYSVEPDMDYLRKRWVHVPGVDSVKPHRISYYDRILSGELKE